MSASRNIPESRCPACGYELFTWQGECPECGGRYEFLTPPRRREPTGEALLWERGPRTLRAWVATAFRIRRRRALAESLDLDAPLQAGRSFQRLGMLLYGLLSAGDVALMGVGECRSVQSHATTNTRNSESLVVRSYTGRPGPALRVRFRGWPDVRLSPGYPRKVGQFPGVFVSGGNRYELRGPTARWLEAVINWVAVVGITACLVLHAVVVQAICGTLLVRGFRRAIVGRTEREWMGPILVEAKRYALPAAAVRWMIRAAVAIGVAYAFRSELLVLAANLPDGGAELPAIAVVFGMPVAAAVIVLVFVPLGSLASTWLALARVRRRLAPSRWQAGPPAE